MPADQIAVQSFCPEFAKGFHVLETVTIHGTFTLNDPEPSAYSQAIEVDGSSCAGSGGYGDVDAGTPVMVKNGKGEILTTSYLEQGRGGRYMCTFGITFDITEGEDRYVVSVGRRGELSYSFADLKAGGVAMVLGG
ncbi:membrane protein [Mycolicibacterium canariasense]|uniref:Membrane protein n=2 Tax=Mycolicibacterium canariasense TaxID=228230 RepID=A0A117IAZ0_MYCCR|nr:membrane protein [Mycolicibacterium canariasense]